MQTPSTTVRRVLAPGAVLAAALVGLTSLAAWGHPGWSPNEVPAGGPVEVELVIPHGCAEDGGEPEEGEGSPITEVALPITDEFTIRPQRVDGFDVLVEENVAVWLALDGGRPAELRLPAVVQVQGEPGTVVPVPVYQECANGEFYRWAATEGEEGDPAVNITIVDGDPEPLPTDSEVPTPGQNLPLVPSTAPTPEPSAAPTPTPTPSGPTPTPTPTPSSEPTPTPSPSAVTPSATPTPSPTAAASPTAVATDATADDGGVNWLLWAGVALFVAIAVFAATRLSGSSSTEDGEGGGPDDATAAGPGDRA